MKTYHPPDWEPTPIFEAWAASTAGQLGLGAILATVVLVAFLLSLRWRRAKDGAADKGDPAEGESRSQS